MCRTWGSNSGPLACQANSLPIELPRPVGPKRIGTATTRGRNGLVPKRPVTKLYESFNTDRFASFVPGSPAIFIENMIARTTNIEKTLKNHKTSAPTGHIDKPLTEKPRDHLDSDFFFSDKMGIFFRS